MQIFFYLRNLPANLVLYRFYNLCLKPMTLPVFDIIKIMASRIAALPRESITKLKRIFGSSANCRIGITIQMKMSVEDFVC